MLEVIFRWLRLGELLTISEDSTQDNELKSLSDESAESLVSKGFHLLSPSEGTQTCALTQGQVQCSCSPWASYCCEASPENKTLSTV